MSDEPYEKALNGFRMTTSTGCCIHFYPVMIASLTGMSGDVQYIQRLA
ncbi:MAG: hypothetical protein ACQER4_09795 [Bacteroidota bacterium]